MVRGSIEQRDYLNLREVEFVRETKERPPCTTLPVGYTPFGRRASYVEAPYLTYLRGRGVSERTRVLYRMGYADDGIYAGRVIVPSFDHTGAINFWSARSIHDVDHALRYRLPFASKDIVSNEHMVDWRQPVFLVEGIFDEVAIGPQAIALNGKFIQQRLMLRLVEHRPPLVHVCLDTDARPEAEKLAARLLTYDLRCTVVDLSEKDPGDLGREGVMEATVRSHIMSSPSDMLNERIGRLT